jgi:hypothetical protein
MNWYELAGPDEVKEVLEDLYRSKWNNNQEWVSTFDQSELHPIYKQSVNFEIAEALWGEYEKEML